MLELNPEFIKDFAAYLSLLCCKSWAEFVNHLKANGVEVQLVMRRDGSKDLKVLQGMRFKKTARWNSQEKILVLTDKSITNRQ